MPKDVNGNNYAHIIVNHFSKYIFIHPAPSQNAKDAARAILRYRAIVGPVQAIISDPGSNYQSEVVKELNSVLGFAQKVSLVDRHESNGVEPYINQVKTHLRALHEDRRLMTAWSQPECIDLIAAEMNSLERRSLGGYTSMDCQYGTLDPGLKYRFDVNPEEAYPHRCTSYYTIPQYILPRIFVTSMYYRIYPI